MTVKLNKDGSIYKSDESIENVKESIFEKFLYEIVLL